MRLITSISNQTDANTAIQSLKTSVNLGDLSCLICYFTEDYSQQDLSTILSSSFPNTPIIGCSSCKGVMTESGYHKGPVIALMSIYDKEVGSAYGTGIVSLKGCTDYAKAARIAIDRALLSANRVGEVPDFVVIHSTPGNEERLIEAIDAQFATQVPIIGGSAGDNTIEGKWLVVTENGCSDEALSILVGFPSKPLTTGLSVGYSPTEFSGVVTRAEGRFIYEIDNDSSKEVYKEWVSDHSGVQISDEYLFDYVSQFPIGTVVGIVGSQPYFKLSHPIRITTDGALEMFAETKVGETITLMTGSREHLINRASRVVKEANTKNYNEAMMLGAIIIFCAGSMLRLGEDMERVYQKIRTQMNGLPFICPFTFGEQGRLIGGENAHGNLMISSAIFYQSEWYV